MSAGMVDAIHVETVDRGIARIPLHAITEIVADRDGNTIVRVAQEYRLPGGVGANMLRLAGGARPLAAMQAAPPPPMAEAIPSPPDVEDRSADQRLAAARQAAGRTRPAFFIKAEQRYATEGESWTTQRREAARFDNRPEAAAALAEWRAGKKPPPDSAQVIEEAA